MESLEKRIGLSGGSLYKLSDDHGVRRGVHDQLTPGRPFEVFFSDPESVRLFRGLADNGWGDYLRTSTFTMHVPGLGDYKYGDGSQVAMKVVEHLRAIYESCGPKHVVIHPSWIAKMSALTGKFPIALENQGPPVDTYMYPYQFEPLLKAAKGAVGLLIDTNHIVGSSRKYKLNPLELLRQFLDSCHDDIYEIHASGCGDNGEHVRLIGADPISQEVTQMAIRALAHALVICESTFSKTNYGIEIPPEIAWLESCLAQAVC